MHEVESISRTVVRLLDAAEVGLMAESRCFIPVLFHLDISTSQAEGPQGRVENTLYVRVILFLEVLRRVQVHSMGVFRVQNDEDGAAPAAQIKYTSN